MAGSREVHRAMKFGERWRWKRDRPPSRTALLRQGRAACRACRTTPTSARPLPQRSVLGRLAEEDPCLLGLLHACVGSIRPTGQRTRSNPCASALRLSNGSSDPRSGGCTSVCGTLPLWEACQLIRSTLATKVLATCKPRYHLHVSQSASLPTALGPDSVLPPFLTDPCRRCTLLHLRQLAEPTVLAPGERPAGPGRPGDSTSMKYTSRQTTAPAPTTLGRRTRVFRVSDSHSSGSDDGDPLLTVVSPRQEIIMFNILGEGECAVVYRGLAPH